MGCLSDMGQLLSIWGSLVFHSRRFLIVILHEEIATIRVFICNMLPCWASPCVFSANILPILPTIGNPRRNRTPRCVEVLDELSTGRHRSLPLITLLSRFDVFIAEYMLAGACSPIILKITLELSHPLFRFIWSFWYAIVNVARKMSLLGRYVALSLFLLY